MVRVAIALGSNMGDRIAVLTEAVRHLESLGSLLALSPLYETEPIGLADQAPFCNAVAVVETDLGAQELVRLLLAIETRLGRVRECRWGPRTIDLDLILHGETVTRSDAVRVPHPRYRKRRFVLEPLLAVWPDARDPDGTAVADLLPAVAAQRVRRLWGVGWTSDDGPAAD